MSKAALSGRLIAPPFLTAAVHTNAAEVGFGGTLNSKDLSPGVPDIYGRLREFVIDVTEQS